MTGWAHDALHGLAQTMQAVRQGRAAGDLSEAEERQVARMLTDIELMVEARDGDGDGRLSGYA